MFIPPGFELRSVKTSLGEMVYSTNRGALWLTAEAENLESETLMFLHGFGGGSSAYEWSKVYPAFAADYTIVAPDLIGWGRSNHPVRNYREQDYIGTITEFIQQTATEPVVAIASSLTAAFTIRVAIANPELFKCLILTTPSGLADFGENYANSLFAQVVSVPILDRLFYTAGVANQNAIRLFLEQRQFANPSRIYDEIVEAYYESAMQKNAEYAALSFVRGDLSFDLSLYIAQLAVPTAIIWGQKTQFTSPELGQRLANLNPQAIRFFEHLPDVGLTPQLELPGVTIGLIRKFLRSF
jgi:pimeloyl-ACP methyl ester carboxylesterase